MDKNKGLLLNADNWQGLYVNGKLIKQGHMIGTDAFIMLLHHFNISPENMYIGYVTYEDDEFVGTYGCFPDKLEKLDGDYYTDNYLLETDVWDY